MQSSRSRIDINGGLIKFKNRMFHSIRKGGIRTQSQQKIHQTIFFLLTRKIQLALFLYTMQKPSKCNLYDDVSSGSMQLPYAKAY